MEYRQIRDLKRKTGLKQNISTCNTAYYDTNGDDEMGTDIEE